jgi:hypothetical protein
VLYENGPVNGTTDAWTINFGYVVSDSFVPSDSPVQGLDVLSVGVPGRQCNVPGLVHHLRSK